VSEERLDVTGVQAKAVEQRRGAQLAVESADGVDVVGEESHGLGVDPARGIDQPGKPRCGGVVVGDVGGVTGGCRRTEQFGHREAEDGLQEAACCRPRGVLPAGWRCGEESLQVP
jgi:hypothetical protein